MKLSKLFVIALLGMSIVSCEDNDDDKAKTVSIEVEINVNGEDYADGDVYAINGYNVKFDNVAMYLGDMGIQLDDRSYTSSDRYFLLKSGTLNLDLGEVEASKLENINFNIGVDPTTNAMSEDDFNSRDKNDPLAVQDPSMHWSWNLGYRFIRIDAKVDLDNNNEYETGLVYHIGTDAFYTNIDKSLDFTLNNEENEFDVEIDIAAILEGLDFNEEADRVTHTNNNLPLAEKVQANLEGAVSVSRD